MLVGDVTKNSDAESRPFAAQWKPAIVITLLVLTMKYFGGHDLALPLFSGAAAFISTIATKWTLRRRAWFWGVMSAFVAGHVLAVMFAVRWQNWVSVKGFVLLAVLDWLGMVWALSLIEKRWGSV